MDCSSDSQCRLTHIYSSIDNVTQQPILLSFRYKILIGSAKIPGRFHLIRKKLSTVFVSDIIFYENGP